MIRINLCETCVHLFPKTDDTDRWSLQRHTQFEEGGAEAISRRYNAPAGRKKTSIKNTLLN